MNVLFTSAGRRVSLLKSFRRALKGPGPGGRILAADLEATAPTLYVADQAFLVPAVSKPEYVSELLAICERESVQALIPLIDPELPVLANHRDRFAGVGTTVLVSSPESVAVGDDKLATAGFFKRHGIPTAETFSPEDARRSLDTGKLRFPLIIKPRHGSSGQGVIRCADEEELRFYLVRQKDAIVQEFLDGYEVTIDVFGDGTGQVLSMVPRRRLKVRGGEVERGVTVDDAPFRHWVLAIAESLKPFGAINIQCFVTERGPVFSEINPRFGGGYPLADAAGAAFPELALQLVAGQALTPRLGEYQRGLTMARYEEAVFVPQGELVR